MNDKLNHEELLRGVHAPGSCRFVTSAPFQLGDVEIVKIGFANIPMCRVTVYTRSDSLRDVVSVVRQHVFYELETAGIPNQAVQFIPRVTTGRRCRFVDCNESSPSKGRIRVGHCCEFSFEIVQEFVSCFVWMSLGRGTIPTSSKVRHDC